MAEAAQSTEVSRQRWAPAGSAPPTPGLLGAVLRAHGVTDRTGRAPASHPALLTHLGQGRRCPSADTAVKLTYVLHTAHLLPDDKQSVTRHPETIMFPVCFRTR